MEADDNLNSLAPKIGLAVQGGLGVDGLHAGAQGEVQRVADVRLGDQEAGGGAGVGELPLVGAWMVVGNQVGAGRGCGGQRERGDCRRSDRAARTRADCRRLPRGRLVHRACRYTPLAGKYVAAADAAAAASNAAGVPSIRLAVALALVLAAAAP